jgi:hypothetical protein
MERKEELSNIVSLAEMRKRKRMQELDRKIGKIWNQDQYEKINEILLVDMQDRIRDLESDVSELIAFTDILNRRLLTLVQEILYSADKKEELESLRARKNPSPRE